MFTWMKQLIQNIFKQLMGCCEDQEIVKNFNLVYVIGCGLNGSKNASCFFVFNCGQIYIATADQRWTSIKWIDLSACV